MLMVGVGITGCSYTPLSYEATNSIDGTAVLDRQFARVSTLPGEAAFVRLPSVFGDILTVNETVYRNGLQQRIIYPNRSGGRGENFIEARLVGKNKIHPVDAELDVHSNDEWGLKTAFRKQFPYAKFEPGTRVRGNRYGGYGVVFAEKSNKVGCIFGWQALEPKTTTGKPDGVINLLLNKRSEFAGGRLSYRISYCAPGLTAEKAHLLMRSITIDASPEDLKRREHTAWFSPAHGVPTDEPLEVFGEPSEFDVAPDYAIVGDQADILIGDVLKDAPAAAKKPVRKVAPRPKPQVKKVVAKKVKRSAPEVVASGDFPVVPLPE